ncbi:hypothetical protein AVEN_111841-1 [Araneus ventricosus]|uniref:Uncharacterized protein n=1 Tax=Araneus ventricosus TaxID=182803 RepID=A0A4Y2BWS0_ARAVE|nr:hypothetical protein AVEN_111841-1 [Araneus ventricosus]
MFQNAGPTHDGTSVESGFEPGSPPVPKPRHYHQATAAPWKYRISVPFPPPARLLLLFCPHYQRPQEPLSRVSDSKLVNSGLETQLYG